MSEVDLDALLARLRVVEDELAIGRLILSYGPAADGLMADRAAALWLDDGTYDWDADGSPFEDRDAVAAMLRTEPHLGLVDGGVAHMTGPPLIEVEGDRATALSYSLVMRRDAEPGRFYLWRVSAVRWDLERDGGSWRVRRRTNRLLDETGAGSELFADALRGRFEDVGR